MFDNIGDKLKRLAKFSCWFGIIGSVISAIALWAANSRYNPTIGLGFVILVVGCLCSWIGTWAIYGIGEAAENSWEARASLQQISRQLSKLQTAEQPAPAPQPTYTPPRLSHRSSEGWICKMCGEKNTASASYCKSCGNYK